MCAYVQSRPRPARAQPALREPKPRLGLAPAAPVVNLEAARPGSSALQEIERIICEFGGDLIAIHEASQRAHRRALALMLSGSAGPLAERIAVTGFAADMVAALAPELADHPDRLRAMIDRLDASGRIPRPILGREALRAAPLLQLAPKAAIEVVLALVLAFSKARAVTLWTQAGNGTLRLAAGAGDLEAIGDEPRAMAKRFLSGQTVTTPEDGEAAAAIVHRWQGPDGVLLVFGEDALSPACRLLLEGAEPALTLALERGAPADTEPRPTGGGASSQQEDALEREMVTAAQRRLARLRFDLHDGPQQDVLMLADDLRQFRARLEGVLAKHPAKERLVGGLDDLEARLVALDGDLRRLSASVQSPFLRPDALPSALTEIASSFAARTGITPALEMAGDLTHLTDSQQITLLALIREALSNIREHTEAQTVAIRVRADDGGLTATVTDDGPGFDPETALVKAAREGHLGLVGMHERVRMLGGRTRIDSRPGGPTVISVSLPAVGAPALDDRA